MLFASILIRTIKVNNKIMVYNNRKFVRYRRNAQLCPSGRRSVSFGDVYTCCTEKYKLLFSEVYSKLKNNTYKKSNPR